MNQAKYKWEDLWAIFEQLIVMPQHSQAEIIAKQHPDMQKELQQLLLAHYSQSPLLDNQPEWQQEFENIFTPPKEINGYTIGKKLGEGSIGEVYKASKKEDGFTRQVAIKFATYGRYSQHVITSFNTELNVLLSLTHPNIERLYDGGVTKDNIPFLIVEYIEGSHINHYCDAHQLTVKQRLKLFQKVCSAVDMVHRSLIVHRDIKASNIMIGADGEPKLLDFGLAKLADVDTSFEENAITSDMMTLAYASPEQVNSEPITTVSDVYSLGVLLYKLLTGNFPYEITSHELKVQQKTISNQLPKLASENLNPESIIFHTDKNLKSNLKGELEKIMAKAIEKQVSQRYLSAIQFSQDIQNYFDNKPIMAWQDGMFYRLRKFVQRHAWGSSLGLLATLTLVALSVSLWIQSIDLKQSIIAIETQKYRVLQVTDFLKGMFKISDPLVTDVKIITIKDLLDYTAQGLDDQFLDQPITKATLYETLGNVYLNLSELNQAEVLFDKAQIIFERQQDSLGRLSIHLDKTRLFQQKGQFNLAQKELETINRQYNVADLDAQTLADIDVFKGQNNYHLGHYNLARKSLESALKQRIALYGEEDERVVDVLQLLGNVYWRLGDFDKVSEYYHRSYANNKKRLGENHHKTIKSKSALGVLAYSQGDLATALKYFNQVAKARELKLGDHHILTAAALNRLGATYFEDSQYPLAEVNLKKAIQIYKMLNLDKSMKYARALNNLGLVQRQSKHYKKAQQTFEKVKLLDLEILGDKHMDLAGVYNNLGMVAADLGEFTKAIELFKKAYQIQFDNNGLNNVIIAFSITNLGRMYMQQGLLEKSQEWLDKGLKLRTEKLGASNLYRIESLSAKAELLMQQNLLEEAKQALLEVVFIREKELPNDDWRLAESKNLLESIRYDGSQEAQKNLICSAQILTHKLGENHYRAVQAQLRLEHLRVDIKVNINCD